MSVKNENAAARFVKCRMLQLRSHRASLISEYRQLSLLPRALKSKDFVPDEG